MSELTVRTFDGQAVKLQSAKDLKSAKAACRKHLGVSRLTSRLAGGMSYQPGLDDEGWTEVASWFLDDNPDGRCASIYRKDGLGEE